MSEEGLPRMIVTLIMMIFTLAMLPAITNSINSVNMTSTISPVEFGFPKIELNDPLQKGIAKNIGTGAMIIILILVSAGIVYALRFLMSVIRGDGEIMEDA